jgi:hypothetical protein
MYLTKIQSVVWYKTINLLSLQNSGIKIYYMQPRLQELAAHKKIITGKEQLVNGALWSYVFKSALEREYSHFYIQLKRQTWAVPSLSLSLGASSPNTSFLECALVLLDEYWGSNFK